MFRIQEILKEIGEIKEIKRDIVGDGKICETIKRARCRPLNDKLKKLKKELGEYENVRAKYLGVLKDYPKDSPLYGFINNNYYADKMNIIATDQIKAEQKVVNKILKKAENKISI